MGEDSTEDQLQAAVESANALWQQVHDGLKEHLDANAAQAAAGELHDAARGHHAKELKLVKLAWKRLAEVQFREHDLKKQLDAEVELLECLVEVIEGKRRTAELEEQLEGSRKEALAERARADAAEVRESRLVEELRKEKDDKKKQLDNEREKVEAEKARADAAEAEVQENCNRVRAAEHRQHDLEKQLENERAKVAAERTRAGYAEAEAQDLRVEATANEYEVEVWRHHIPRTDVSWWSKASLIPRVQQALRQMVPPDHYAECDAVRSKVVTDLHRIVNVNLWMRYSLKRRQVAQALRHRGGWQHLAETCVALPLPEALPHLVLDESANEVLLLHGTDWETAYDIAQQGFDMRMSCRTAFGHGVYLTIDACKAFQYGDVLVIARALLGHPHVATDKDAVQGQLRPPLVPGLRVPHDSTIAEPGIPNHRGCQVHWEFVVHSEQLYPEFIVNYPHGAE